MTETPTAKHRAEHADAVEFTRQHLPTIVAGLAANPKVYDEDKAWDDLILEADEIVSAMHRRITEWEERLRGMNLL